ncbi:MAG: DUF4446 family protein [Thermoanaerobacteraceae bacterium]|nr:DUF4446 family protein [Thermoanaerobacteraceae bacterium]
MQQLLTLINKYIVLIVLFIFLLNIFELLIILAINSKYSKLKRQYKNVMREIGTNDIIEILSENIKKTEEFNSKLDKFRMELSMINNEMKAAIKKVGIIRYNAFNDVGSDLSFSIALLDSEDNGIVLSGIYGRNETATFAKPVEKGQSKYPLSAEEIQAIDKARKAII